MASTQRKSSADTTQRKLNTFFAQNIFFVFLLTICTVLFCLLSDLRYRQLGHQQMELHNFYRNLETLHSQLTAYAARGDDTILKAKETSLSCLKDSAKVLADIPVDAVYQRDMADTALMLDRYSAALDQVLSSLRPDRRNHSYYEADSIYSAINAGFRSLNFQILEHTNRKMETFQKTQRHFITLITLFLAFMIGADVIYSIRLSHSIVDPITELTTSIQGLYLTHVEDYREVSLFCASNQEMNILVSVFNSMIKTIQGQMEKIRENADIAIKLHQKEVENLQIANLLRTSQLKSLQMQINPHFLFNTLNSLYSLVIGTSEKAEDAFIKFTDILKYTYSSIDKEWVTVDDEAGYISSYIDLQAIRLDSHTHVEWNYKADEPNALIPPMVLLTFVENAFKYGASTRSDCHISISLTLYDGQLTFTTRNRIVKRADEFRTEMPVGIENCRARLGALYPGRHTLDTTEADGEFFVTLNIQLQ